VQALLVELGDDIVQVAVPSLIGIRSFELAWRLDAIERDEERARGRGAIATLDVADVDGGNPGVASAAQIAAPIVDVRIAEIVGAAGGIRLEGEGDRDRHRGAGRDAVDEVSAGRKVCLKASVRRGPERRRAARFEVHEGHGRRTRRAIDAGEGYEEPVDGDEGEVAQHALGIECRLVGHLALAVLGEQEAPGDERRRRSRRRPPGPRLLDGEGLDGRDLRRLGASTDGDECRDCERLRYDPRDGSRATRWNRHRPSNGASTTHNVGLYPC
jgi:hypothetical protein